MQRFFAPLARLRRRAAYLMLSVLLAFGLAIGTPQMAQASDWLEWIFRGVQILQISNLSDRQEVALGQQIDRQLTRSQVRIYNNPRLSDYLDSVGQRLVSASSRPDIPYTFRVVADRGINAFATLGGFVYLNAGLIATADNEAQLASVMAHEIGHVAARHAVQNLREAAIADGLLSAAGLDTNDAVRLGVELAIRRPGSRRDELEADALGLATMGRAGYAQVGMVEFMRKLLDAPSPPEFLSTHPNTEDRIAAIQRAIDPNAAYGAGLDNRAYQRFLQSVFR